MRKMINWRRLILFVVLLVFMGGVLKLVGSVLGPKVYVEPEHIRINKRELAKALDETISRHKNGETPVIDLSAAITIFSWDRLYVFGPYTEMSKMEDIIGETWNDHESCVTVISYSDGVALLVFTKNEQVVQCLDYGRDGNDFADLEKYETGFSIDQARFILDERGNLVWVSNK